MSHHLSTFVTEVTPPVGHPLLGGQYAPAKEVADPLFVMGLTLLGPEAPIVLATIDWCEIRNDAYEAWRRALADAAHTTPERVLFSCVHQHDAPLADLEAERILERAGANVRIIDLDFHEKTVARAAEALRASLKAPSPITHLGTGAAKVERIASNRRVVFPDGTVSFGRMSASAPEFRAPPEGLIDPSLRTLSFWNGDEPIAAWSAYATHPMSYYGKGAISADFVGLARRRRQADDPKIAQLYASGCSGNVTAGKYNDGAPENRPALADRLYQAMVAAWKATEKRPLTQATFRSTTVRFPPRDEKGFRIPDLEAAVADANAPPFRRALAAMGLSTRRRWEKTATIDVPMIDYGVAKQLLLPAESYVEFQLAAQELAPDAFVVVAGYGECAPGYIPTDKHFLERDANLGDWCWVAPGAEGQLRAALAKVMQF